MIKKILRKDVNDLIQNEKFWKHPFLSITKHRLYAHYLNPNISDNDIVLLLAYYNKEIVGYMGVYVDVINIKNKDRKIGWLSTWWVHPKTKGTGIGRSLLVSMYKAFNGRIGVSQFTPIAKKVYKKSGFFQTLSKSIGYKFVFRSNLNIVFPLYNEKFNRLKPLFSFVDFIVNIPLQIKNNLHEIILQRNLDKIKIEYVNLIDNALMKFIKSKSIYNLSKKNIKFFHWLKAYHWVQEAPLTKYTEDKKYFFSMFAKNFNIYFVKVIKFNKIIGFVVLQRKNHQLKVLFVYYNNEFFQDISKIILLHCFKLKIKEMICYDDLINSRIKSSLTYLYRRLRKKESIISKDFGKIDYKKYNFNFGDGDCCFA